MSQNFIKNVLGFALLFILFPAAYAQDESPWHEGDFARTRLVASHKSVPIEDGGAFYLGFQVQLPEGWKTYWRTPGSAGLPPQFIWDGSENISNVEVYFPSPDRFEIFNLHTYGYHDEVIYPILVTPVALGRAVSIKLKVNYLICKDLCVPASDAFELFIPATGEAAAVSLNAGLIARYLALVPAKVSDAGDKVQILEHKVLGSPGAQNLVLRLRATGLMSGADLIVEDMTEFKFGIPLKRMLADASEAEFIIPVFAQSEGASLLGKQIVLTISDGWDNFEEISLKIHN